MNKKYIILLLIFTITPILYLTSSCCANTYDKYISEWKTLKQEIDYKNSEIIVKFKKPSHKSQVYFFASNMRNYSLLKIKNLFPDKNSPEIFKNKLFKLTINQNANVIKSCKELTKHPKVEYAEPNFIYHKKFKQTNDSLFDNLWGIKKIKVNQAWDRTEGNNDILIAILDTGCDIYHEDLKDNILYAKNFIDSSRPIDFYGHGTHVAGIISAINNNHRGITGIAPNCKIMPLKIGPGPDIFTLAAVKAIVYAVEKKTDIINMSWGGTYESITLIKAIKYAYSKNITLIAAAGNNNDDTKYYTPAKYPETITVAATDENDKRAKFSNYGQAIDISAPGVNILSSVPNNRYKSYEGTSTAAPYVTGVVALMKSIKSDLTNNQIKQIIKENADKTITDKPIGTGRINAIKIIEYIKTNLKSSIRKTDSSMNKLLKETNLEETIEKALLVLK